MNAKGERDHSFCNFFMSATSEKFWITCGSAGRFLRWPDRFLFGNSAPSHSKRIFPMSQVGQAPNQYDSGRKDYTHQFYASIGTKANGWSVQNQSLARNRVFVCYLRLRPGIDAIAPHQSLYVPQRPGPGFVPWINIRPLGNAILLRWNRGEVEMRGIWRESWSKQSPSCPVPRTWSSSHYWTTTHGAVRMSGTGACSSRAWFGQLSYCWVCKWDRPTTKSHAFRRNY